MEANSTNAKLGFPTIVGLVIVAAFFGLFGSWAALAPLNSAAVAPGEVSVASGNKTVQHLEGGIVADILVNEGDQVTQGDVVVRLEATQPQANLDLLTGRWFSTKVLEARLIAERDGNEKMAMESIDVSTRFQNRFETLSAAQLKVFEARKNTLKGQVSILRQRETELEEEIRGLDKQVIAEKEQIRLIALEVADVEQLIDKGLARKPRLLALQRTAAELEGSLGQNIARIASTKQKIGEARLQGQELLTARYDEVTSELNDIQSDLLELNQQIYASEDVLRRTVVSAPYSGRVVNLRIHTAGGVINPGEPLMDIVPWDDKLLVEARVSPNDIDIVHVGLPAQVFLTAYSRRTSTPLEGTVASISADRLIDDQSGEQYFLARVEVENLQGNLGDGLAVVPGMQAEVLIVTGERTFLDYLMQPILDSFNRALRES